MQVSRTLIMLTVLHPTDQPLPENLAIVLEEMDTGNAVGAETGRVTHELPADQVGFELIALGNDGDFFKGDEDD